MCRIMISLNKSARAALPLSTFLYVTEDDFGIVELL
jgi:hypothetical protein